MSVVVRRLASFAFLLGIASIAGAQTAPPIARYVPSVPNASHVFVLDSAHLLLPETVAALQDSARALQSETQADVAWVTLPTLGGRPIEEAALYIGRTWKIGTPGHPGDPMRNRGLVILYVPDKTKTAGPNFRIEVGNGLEGTITDSRSRAITTAMRDGLKAKRYDAAYMAGWAVAAALVREDFASHGIKAPVVAEVPSPAAKSDSSNAITGAVFLVIVVVFLAIIIVSRRRAARSPTMAFNRNDDDDDDRRRRSPMWMGGGSGSDSDSSSSSGSDSGGSSSSGDFGGGGGFSGGGSSDSI